MKEAEQHLINQKKQKLQAISPLDIGISDKINGLKIRKIEWSDFKGKVPKNSPYSAHIYWSIDYEIHKPHNMKKHFVTTDVKVSPKSWVINDKKKPQLLMHQYGHYLIGCICALIFQKRVNQQFRQPLTFDFNEWCYSIFRDTLNQHLKLQKKYDDATDHRMNHAKQVQWEKMLLKTINELDKQKQTMKSEKLISIQTSDQSTTGNIGERSRSSTSSYYKAKNKEERAKQRKDFSIHKLPSIPKPSDKRTLPPPKRQSNKTLI